MCGGNFLVFSGCFGVFETLVVGAEGRREVRSPNSAKLLYGRCQSVATYAHHVIIQMIFYCHNVHCTQFPGYVRRTASTYAASSHAQYIGSADSTFCVHVVSYLSKHRKNKQLEFGVYFIIQFRCVLPLFHFFVPFPKPF